MGKEEVKSEIKREKKDKKSLKKAVLGLAISCGILGAGVVTLGSLYGVTLNEKDGYQTQVENVYQKNLYDLVGALNNAETKLSKVLSSSSIDYQNKMLIEVANDCELASQSISSLPISQGSFDDSIRFINQVNGYTTTLAKELAKGKEITSLQKETLSNIENSLVSIKEEINSFIDEVGNGYSIVKESSKLADNVNSFTIRISKIKQNNIDYPSMIYDGPFSDSETNVEIKGLKGDVVDKDKALSELLKCFKNIESSEYLGEINSRIETYNFKLITTTQNTLYAQVTKINGNVITVSGMSTSLDLNQISIDQAKQIAIDFAKENGIINPESVWSDVLQNEAYFNIAPTEKGIILYPDLVKVKIDLTSGVVIGYDASTYFTNHTNRLLPKASISPEEAAKSLPEGYNFAPARLVLAPLEYSREVLCYEFEGSKDDSTYYFYINAQTGQEENILKVVKTTDGEKLM